MPGEFPHNRPNSINSSVVNLLWGRKLVQRRPSDTAFLSRIAPEKYIGRLQAIIGTGKVIIPSKDGRWLYFELILNIKNKKVFQLLQKGGSNNCELCTNVVDPDSFHPNPAFQVNPILLLWVIFSLLDPDPGTTSNPDPDPHHCCVQCVP